MRMLSGRMHWLTVGLALLVSAQGLATRQLHGQAPLNPAARAAQRQAAMPASYGAPMGMAGGPTYAGGMPGGMPGGGMINPDGPMSLVLQGPPPMDVVYEQGGYGGGCDGMGCNGGCGGACGGGMGGCGACGGSGCRACGLGGQLLSRLGGCQACGGSGCSMCGLGNGCLFSGRGLGLLGILAPYSEGGRGSQRWFDFYAGTMALTRTSDVGSFGSTVRDQITGEFLQTNVVSTDGISGTPVLRTTDLDMDDLRFGLELIANLQTGPGANVEARYFGLNNWNTSASFNTIARGTPDIFSVFSDYGVSPAGGFDDTDRSFVHTLSYNSELHSGEVNYRRRFVPPMAWAQGSWLMGIRYFDLDERMGFNATGSNNNTFQFDELRFFNYDTRTRNQLTGFQIGGDMWINVVPGISLGVESKTGIYGNHAEVEAQAVANSIPGAREHLQDGKTAFLSEFSASAVYRLTYSWSVRGSYNLLYVDNVALAPENFNPRDFSNAVGTGATGNFTATRFPFINTDGEVFYQGFSVGGEYLF